MEGDPAPAHRRHDHRAPTPSRRTSPTSFLRGNTSWRRERLRRAHRRGLRAQATWARTSWARATSLELYLHVSAGRYMCGEETGLLNALEGKRAIPRAKPPFPQVSRPVGQADHRQQRGDALQRAAHLSHGAEWFKSLSRTAGRRHQALRRQRQGEAPGPVGTADGHDHRARSWKNMPAACATAASSAGCCPAAPRPTF